MREMNMKEMNTREMDTSEMECSDDLPFGYAFGRFFNFFSILDFEHSAIYLTLKFRNIHVLNISPMLPEPQYKHNTNRTTTLSQDPISHLLNPHST
jgi:hypothetical protein